MDAFGGISHQVQVGLGQVGIQPAVLGQGTQTLHLFRLPPRIRGSETRLGLQVAYLPGHPETLGQHVDDRSIDIVHTGSELFHLTGPIRHLRVPRPDLVMNRSLCFLVVHNIPVYRLT